MHFRPRTQVRSVVYLLALGLAAYALPSGMAAQVGQAPGGFVELMTSTAARPQPNASQIAQFVPSTRGRFSFPAPYNTEGYRITIPSDCGGADCIQQEGYSAWRNINAHAGQPVLRMFIGLQDTTYVTLFTLDKTTGVVTNNGSIFGPVSGGNPLTYSRGGGWFWSGSDPDILYAYATSQLVAKNVVTGAQSVVLDLASSGAQAATGLGPNVRVWAATGSDDGNSWAMTARQTVSPFADAGCALYHRPTNAWHFIAGPMGDCYVDKSGTYWTAGVAGAFQGIDIRAGTMNPFSIGDLLTDPMGAPGHLDHGFGFLLGEDNWAPMGQTLRLWDLSQPFGAAGQGRTVHTMTQWGNNSYVQPTMGNARPATMGTIGNQYACSTATFSAAPSPAAPREREIVCFVLDGSGRTLVVAPNMTDMNAPGGGITYYRAPKGNLDTTGEYYYWITNLGGSRLEAFLVRVPYQVLMGAGSGDSTPPTVNLTAPANGATVSGTVTASANAADNVAVAAVQFQVDGVNVGTEDTTSPYSISWNTTGTGNGAHTVTALARDSSGNWRTSTAVTVNVANGGSGDTTDPNVVMSSPSDGSTVSGTINVTANASDNVGVVGVQFRLDGVNAGTEDTSSPYTISWNTAGTSNGSHTISAVARDAAGNTRTSAAISITVQNQAGGDTTQPSVSMSAPANGSTVSGMVNVSANASDNIGVAGVQFLLDGQNLGAEDTSSPFTISWNTASSSAGSHAITARARDLAGNTRTSSSVSVTVQNQSPGDTTQPTVSMASPANGALVSGNVLVSASASDNIAVVGVQFRLDNLNLGPELTAAPYTMLWNAGGTASGSHSLTAIARDAAGNTRTASSVSVTVQNLESGSDSTPPTVAMTSPVNGASVSGSIVVAANATDNVGISEVQFRLDGANLGPPIIAPPFAMSWNTAAVPAGSTHTLTAIARDAAGNTTSASTVSFTVRASTTAGGATPRSQPLRISWTSLVNSRIYLWRLRKTGGTDGSPDGGAVSAERVNNGDAYFEFTASTSARTYYVGLGAGSPGTSPVDMDFGLRLNGSIAEVREADVLKATEPIRDGDVFRIGVVANLVTYARNGSVFYTSQRAPIYPIAVRAVLLDKSAEINRAFYWRPSNAAANVVSPGSSTTGGGVGVSNAARPSIGGSSTDSGLRAARGRDDVPLVTESFARLSFVELDPARSGASLVGSWALGLLEKADANVTAIYLYAQPTDGSSETPTFLGAVAPDQPGQPTAEAGRTQRARFVVAVSELPPGTYTVTAFAQTATGAPVEIASITLIVR